MYKMSQNLQKLVFLMNMSCVKVFYSEKRAKTANPYPTTDFSTTAGSGAKSATTAAFIFTAICCSFTCISQFRVGSLKDCHIK